jgi:TfoX C-terminal domain
MKSSQVCRVSNLVNIGTLTERLLNEANIYTQVELEEAGAVEAWRRIKSKHPERATFSFLFALQGALLSVPGNALPEEVIMELLNRALSVQ